MVETLFREAHSLKGAARAVELGDIESVCQAMESVFAAWKRGEIAASAELFDALNEAVDTLRESSAHGRDSASAAESMGGLISHLARIAESGKPAAEAAAEEPQGAPAAAPAAASAASARAQGPTCRSRRRAGQARSAGAQSRGRRSRRAVRRPDRRPGRRLPTSRVRATPSECRSRA